MRGPIFLVVVMFYLLVTDFRIKLVRVFHPKGSRWFVQGSYRKWAGTLVKFAEIIAGMDLRVTKPSQGLPTPCIVISNHQSLVDIMAMMVKFRSSELRFVAKAELGHHFWTASEVLRGLGHALIRRKGAMRETMDSLRSFGKRCAQKGWSPVVFPEGTRSRDGQLSPFQSAGFRMIYRQHPVPVVVVSVKGGINFAALKHFIAAKPFLYEIKVLDVIDPSYGSWKDIFSRAQQLISRDVQADHLFSNPNPTVE